jgi:hypothetical protein
MHAPSFDGSMMVLTDRPLKRGLVKATNVRLNYDTVSMSRRQPAVTQSVYSQLSSAAAGRRKALARQFCLEKISCNWGCGFLEG